MVVAPRVRVASRETGTICAARAPLLSYSQEGNDARPHRRVRIASATCRSRANATGFARKSMPEADAAVQSARGVRAGAGARDGSHVLIFITKPKIQDRHPLALSYPPPPATAGGGQRRADRVSQARCVPIARDRQAAWPSSSAPPDCWEGSATRLHCMRGADAGASQSRGTGTMRATNAPPRHRWGKAAPRGRTMCAAACALRSRKYEYYPLRPTRIRRKGSGRIVSTRLNARSTS